MTGTSNTKINKTLSWPWSAGSLPPWFWARPCWGLTQTSWKWNWISGAVLGHLYCVKVLSGFWCPVRTKITLLAEEQSQIIASEYNVLQRKAGWNGNRVEVRLSSAWRVLEGFRRGWDLVKPLSETLKGEKKLLSYYIAQWTLGSVCLFQAEPSAWMSQNQKSPTACSSGHGSYRISLSLSLCNCVCVVCIGVRELIRLSDVAWVDCIFISFLGESSSILAYWRL